MAEAARKSWTYEALLAEGLDPKSYEIVDGELVEVGAVSIEGANVWSELDHRLRAHVKAHDLGMVGICGRFRLRETPRLERRPDLAFLTKERTQERPLPDLFPGAPDLAIEIISPSDPSAAAAAKAKGYLDHGAREVWIVDPAMQTITVFRPDAFPRAFDRGDALTSDLLPGFSLSLAELFTA